MWNNPETGKSGWLLAEIDGKPINGGGELPSEKTSVLYRGLRGSSLSG